MLDVIRPDWPAPANVLALTTTRLGGGSAPPFDSFNLGDHVGDDAAAVAANRQTLLDHCAGLRAVGWLEQVHGTGVVAADAQRKQRADAQFTRARNLACAIMTADCLPVLFCDRDGAQVAAAHAGWRGLCAGVLEKTVATFADPARVLAWFGPAIGPANFEVGAEVREQFLSATSNSVALAEQIAACFRAAGPQNYYADIYALASARLRAVGVDAIYGGGLCTVADRARFYSYRRDGRCGRMATLIYLNAAD
jgi:YfiH family protein